MQTKVLPLPFDRRIFWSGALLFLFLEAVGLLLISQLSMKLILAGAVTFFLLILVLIRPFNGVLIFLAIEYSGIVWGLEIPNGFIIVVFLVTFAWLFERFLTLNWTFRLSPVFFWIFGFYSAILVSGFFAFRVEAVLAQLFFYVELTFLLFLLLQFLDSRERILTAVNTLIFAVFFSIAVGLLAMFTKIPFLGQIEQGFRFRGLSGDPNIIATQILIVLPILVLRFFSRKNWMKKLFLLGLILLNGFGLIATFSRSAVLGLGVVILVLLYMLRKNRKLLMVALIMAVIGLILVPDIVWERIQSLQDVSLDPSLRWRVRIYLLAFQLFTTHPIFGIGMGNFLFFSHTVTTEHLATHSTFLEIAVETGIFGLFFYSGFIFFTIFSLKKAAERFDRDGDQELSMLCRGFLVSFLGLLAVAQFISLERFVSLWMLMAISIALIELPLQEKRKNGAN